MIDDAWILFLNELEENPIKELDFSHAGDKLLRSVGTGNLHRGTETRW